MSISLRSDRGPIAQPTTLPGQLHQARASATPIGAAARLGAEAAQAADALAPIAGPLSELQAWFLEHITHPEGVERASAEAKVDLGASSYAQLIRVHRGMSPAARLEIYREAYFARLVECLADDYPQIQHYLGAEAFQELALEYIALHPSTGPNLNRFGARFPEFLSATGRDPFLRDLARLEWALVEVVHAPAEPSLSLAELQAVAPEDWAALRLRPRATLRLLELDYPVNAYFQAEREGNEPGAPAPAWSATAVYRVGFELWRMDFTPVMAAVLKALLQGEALGEALSLALQEEDPNEADVRVWFSDWVAGGFFRELSPGGGGPSGTRARRRGAKTTKRKLENKS